MARGERIGAIVGAAMMLTSHQGAADVAQCRALHETKVATRTAYKNDCPVRWVVHRNRVVPGPQGSKCLDLKRAMTQARRNEKIACTKPVEAKN